VELSAAYGGWARRTSEMSSYQGLTDLEFAAKFELIRDPGGASLAGLAGVRMPTGSTAFRAERARPRLGVLSSSPVGQGAAFHVAAVVEHRPEAPPDGIIETQGGISIAAAERSRPAAILLERVIAALDVAPAGAWGNSLEVYFRRDPDLADPETLGLALGTRWLVSPGFMTAISIGCGVSDPADSKALEWFVAVGVGYGLGLAPGPGAW
jgi:hypothetical protein